VAFPAPPLVARNRDGYSSRLETQTIWQTSRTHKLARPARLGGASKAIPSAPRCLHTKGFNHDHSPAVITDGGRIVWLAGMGGITDADGKPITDFAGQTRRAFQNIEATLKRAGGTLADIVTMTVFIRNQADGDEFVKFRGEIFKSGFPASALITAKDFAVPQLLVEIQAIAVIGERNDGTGRR
jgi:2-iminobutanoate/2-iminopropanoate deaminase